MCSWANTCRGEDNRMIRGKVVWRVLGGCYKGGEGKFERGKVWGAYWKGQRCLRGMGGRVM